MFSLAHYQAVHEAAGVLDRSDRGRLRLTGTDRRSYLQGLLTNDILALESGRGCYAAMLTAQGRMITDMRVLELGDAVLVDLPARVASKIRDHLDQFVITEDVVVSDVSTSLVQLGVYGPRAANVLSAAFDRIKAADESAPPAGLLRAMSIFESARWDAGGAPAIVVRSDDFGLDGFEVFVEAAFADAVRNALLDQGAVAIDQEAAEVSRIEAGQPAFGTDMDESTIPLEAGIEDRGISQTKGCYVGQEIIIRVLHRGHGRVARRLVGLLPDRLQPERGDRVRSGDREIGVITSAAHSPALGRPIALGYVHRDFVSPGTQVSIESAAGSTNAVVSRVPLVPRQVESTHL